MRQELLIGCGVSRKKMIWIGEDHKTFGEGLITLDINPDRNPDVVWDLENLPLPFDDNMFDEVHAYHVLEHLGSQGDYKQFFGLFSEIWRIMRPGGFFMCAVPNSQSQWAFGDPSHKKIVHPYQFGFLNQEYMRSEVERGSMASDFRYIYKADFGIVSSQSDDNQFCIILGVIK